MKKKMYLSLLSGVLAAGVLSGCGTTNDDNIVDPMFDPTENNRELNRGYDTGDDFNGRGLNRDGIDTHGNRGGLGNDGFNGRGMNGDLDGRDQNRGLDNDIDREEQQRYRNSRQNNNNNNGFTEEMGYGHNLVDEDGLGDVLVNREHYEMVRQRDNR
ncbi:hypothetical protein QA612_07215 [Evansella sp. AB-P1]|uniref:hypothetical protein n=1 Tax=Evansella sp. AB-P1 TaxID=3037653 RepID=UPI00241CBF57|nr:hypothetical protein [Evansella sp. AB-P1]MDG5787279.1 hypothetical protein [Evansella sp. AB-P1]